MGIRRFVYPINRDELKVFLPMTFLLFFIIYNAYITWTIKDALIVINLGPETIPFLKVLAVLPCTVIAFMIYIRLSNSLSQQTIFCYTVTVFTVFFLIFAQLIYPNYESFHPRTSLYFLKEFLPKKLYPIMLIYQHLAFTIYYVMADLWMVMVSMFFWQFANKIIAFEKAKRYYIQFNLIANVAVIIAGISTRQVTKLINTSTGVYDWGPSLKILTWSITFSGIIILVLYYYLTKNTEKNTSLTYDKTVKFKLNAFQSIKLIFSNLHLLSILGLVLCYGVCSHLIDIVWKSNLRESYSTIEEYISFLGIYTSMIGVSTIISTILGNVIITKFGWRVTAILTPIILVITSSILLFTHSFKDIIFSFFEISFQPGIIFITIGFIQNLLIKGFKHSLFSSTKEMAYIPLNLEDKTKGKAAIDMIGNRLGKSGGGVILQLLFVYFGSLSALLLPALLIILVITLVWIIIVIKLDRLIKLGLNK